MYVSLRRLPTVGDLDQQPYEQRNGRANQDYDERENQDDTEQHHRITTPLRAMHPFLDARVGVDGGPVRLSLFGAARPVTSSL
jgi:hypothetical protein